MNWKGEFLILCACVFLIQEMVIGQYIPGNTGCSCQNMPVRQNLPIVNRPICNSLPNPNVLHRNNVYNANANNIPSTEKLALVNLNVPIGNSNVPIGRLNVPIVNNVPAGALAVARNVPITNCACESNANDINILGNEMNINYRNIGPPTNIISRLPLNNVPINDLGNLQFNNIINTPNNVIPNLSSPVINRIRACTPNERIPDYLINNIANVRTTNTVPSNTIRNIDNRLINSVPFNNIANIPVNYNNYINNIGNVPITNANNLPINNVGNIPINNGNSCPNNYYRISNNVPTNNIANIPINNCNSPTNVLDMPLINNLASLPINLANVPITRTANTQLVNQDCGCSSSTVAANKLVAKVPVVPLTSLNNLPAYNGMPVIKVSESVFKLTPVN